MDLIIHSKELLKTNLELFAKIYDPLPQLSQNNWEFCKTGKKEQLNLRRSGTDETLMSAQNLEVEVRQWVGLFDPNNVEWVVVYGIGLGYYYLGLKNWLAGNPKRHVIFIEDDLSVLYSFLETDAAEKILNDPQANILYFPPDEVRTTAFQTLIQRSLFREIYIGALASYQSKKAAAFENLMFLIKFFRGIHESSTSEYLSHGKTFFKNFYHNVLGLDSTFDGTAFEGQFKGVPAIICGAGPSLAKNIEVLKTLKDKALIFAGGTAMNALNAYGVIPHFGCGIDPFNFHYSRILSNIAFETPFFFRSRMNADGVALLHGPRVYLPGTTGYPIAERLDEDLKYTPFKIDEGTNVINTTLSIAQKLGCNPIIFVGLDLAYTDGLSYPPGITSHGIHDPREQFVTKGKQDELVLVKDIYGQPIYTLMKWMVESTWYSAFARNFSDVQLFNCTEGGIGFSEVKNILLSEVVSTHLKQSLDIEGKISSILLSAKGRKAPSVEETKQVLAKIVEQISDVANLMTSFQAEHPDIWNEKLPNNSEELSTFEEILKKLPAYQYLLKLFDESYQKFMKAPAANERAAKLSDVQELLNGRFPYLAEIVLENLKYIQKSIKRKILWEFAKNIVTQQFPTVPEVQILDNSLESNLSIHRYPSGQILSSIPYKNGVKHGLAQTFNENGQVLSSRPFENGIEEGIQLYFYPDGKLKSQIEYSQGILNGEIKLFYPNGVLKRSCFYRMGKREGIDILNYINGTPLLSAEYQDDKPIGRATTWHIDGPISKVISYFTPGVVAEIKRWDTQGNHLPEVEHSRDYIDSAVVSSIQLQNSIEGMASGLEGIVQTVGNTLSPQIKNELEQNIASIETEMAHLKELSSELLDASGISGNGIEAIWKTPSNEVDLNSFLQAITSPMQEAMLMQQWQLRALIQEIEKKHQSDEKKTDE